LLISLIYWGCRGRMVVGFTTTYAISDNTQVVSSNPVHVLDTTLCGKVCLTYGRSVVFSEYSGFLNQ
jgi:hypothetical protein